MLQGTIKLYNEATRSGIILDDAGAEFAFDYESFRTTGMRLFRLGQRVKWRPEEGTKVRELTLLTL